MFDKTRNIFLEKYAIAKDLVGFKGNTTYNTDTIKEAIALLLATAIWVFEFTLFMPFIIFHTCLNIVLKLIHGKFYGGLLKGQDAMFEINPETDVINVVIILACNDNPLLLIDKVKTHVYNLYQSSFKFSCKIQRMLGYFYYLKHQIKFENVINILKYNDNEYMSKDNLFDYIEQKCLTIKENQTWKATFFSQPICWSSSKGNTHIALILTFRHSLGDFPCILGFVKKHLLVTRDVEVRIPKCYTYERDLNLNNVCLIKNPWTTILKGYGLGRKKNDNDGLQIVTFIEQEVKYLPKIKQMQKKFNVTFVEVCTAAICESVYSYISQEKLKIRHFVMLTLVRAIKKEVEELVNRTFNFKVLKNTFGTLMFDIMFKSKTETVKSRLLDIHGYYKLLPNAMDVPIIYRTFCNICEYLPAGLIYYCHKWLGNNQLIGISNVIGLPKSTCGGSVVDDIYFFGPRTINLSLMIFIHSYAERIQLVAVARTGFVNNKEALKGIIENIFRNIDELEKS